MMYIVLSEVDRDGAFVPAIALSSGDTVDAVAFTLYGTPHTITAYPSRLGAVGTLRNSIDISQAMGGVPQAIEFDFEVIDWAGFSRISIGMFDATSRFVGWECTVIIDHAIAASLAVRGVATNGDTISFSCASRFEAVDRPCAFDSRGAQVGLVVGGHDVSVETARLPDPVGIFRDIPGTLYQGNPSAPSNFYASSNVASRKRNIGANYDFFFDCKNSTDAIRFREEIRLLIESGETVVLVGKEMSWLVPYTFSSPYEFGLMIPVSKAFYDTESPGDVTLVRQPVGGAIAAGASSLVGFIDSVRASVPEGIQSTSGGVLSFRPTSLVPSGFRSFERLPCSIAWNLAGISQSDYYAHGTEDIKTDGTDPGEFDDITTANVSLPPSSPTKFTVWDSLLDSLDSLSKMRFSASAPIDWTPDRIVVDMKARLVWDGSFASIPDANIPFYKRNFFVDRPSGEFSILPRGPGYFDPDLAFDSVDDLNNSVATWYKIETTSSGASLDAAFQLLAVTIYGQTNLAFGTNHALVTPGPGPLDAPEGEYPARQTAGVTLPEAAACILSANGWYPQNPGDFPVGTVPTWTPQASAVGEFLEPELTYIKAAERLAQESWAIFALESNAIGQSDELPVPPRIRLGQDTDVITEPSIEYQPFGGEHLGRAYVSNVDLPFNASNPDAFYGGWGVAPAGAEEPEGTDYGLLIWQRCRAAFLEHGIKRGQTYQFNGVHDAATMGRMLWEAKRNGARRIDWLAFHPRYMTFSVKRFSSFGWAGSATRLPQIMASGAGYDISQYSPLYDEAVTVVEVIVDPMTGITEFSVALPPIPSDGHDIGLSTDSLNPALDLSVDTLDSGLALTTDTLEP